MPSTYSNLGLELQATGENANTWGDRTNVGLQRLDNAIAGYAVVPCNSQSITLTFSTNSGTTTFTDENGRNKILKFTDDTPGGAVTVTVPDVEKEYLVRNESGQTITFTAGGSTTVALANNKNAHIYVDGASAVYNALEDPAFDSLTATTLTVSNTATLSSAFVTLGGDIDANGQNIQFDDATGIHDDSDNEQLIFQKTASAVNHFEMTNQATGSNPSFSATGSDTNVGIDFSTKGTGFLKFNDGAYFPEATLTDGATISWDAQSEPVCKVELGGNRTLSSATNGVTGQFISILVQQDSTGTRTLTWNADYEFKDDTAPTLTTTASKGDIFVFRYNGTKWLEVGRNLNLTLS